MNNKGFAITTIIFGTMVLFCLLLVSLLGILSTYKNNLEKLIDSDHGTRDIVTMKPNETYNNLDDLKKDGNHKSGLYCFTDDESDDCYYVSNAELK